MNKIQELSIIILNQLPNIGFLAFFLLAGVLIAMISAVVRITCAVMENKAHEREIMRKIERINEIHHRQEEEIEERQKRIYKHE